MNRSLIVAAILTAAIFGSSAWLAVQAHGASAASAPGKASCCADKAGCGGKMGMSPDMAAKMAEADKRMDELAAKMNSASGDAKVETMAALLNEIVARHKTMHETMHARHEAMCGEGAKTEEKSEGSLLGEHEHGK